jgi:hypothetical protein
LAGVESLESRDLLATVLPSPGGQSPTEVIAKPTHLEKANHPAAKPTHLVKADAHAVKAKPTHQAPVHPVVHSKPAHPPKATVSRHR